MKPESKTLVESITDLKKRVQEPVRRYNDISGMLVGDHLSIFITRFFIARGWSPTIATVGMLVAGVGGSVLIALGDQPAVAGFALVFFAYILDCVDGEVARYHKIEKVFWSFHDYLFHYYIKSAFFLCIGYAGFQSSGSVWLIGLAWLGFSVTVFGKFVRELPVLLVNRHILQRNPNPEDRSYEQLTRDITDEELDGDPVECRNDDPASYGGLLSRVRSFLTNFDLMMLVFLAAAITDLMVGPFVLLGITVNLKVAVLTLFVAVLTVDFLDRLIYATRDDRLLHDGARILERMHHFRIRR